MNIEEYMEWLSKQLVGEFKPCALINKYAPGQMLEVFWSNEAYIAERLNNRITLFKSASNRNKIVGVQIEGLDQLLKDGST